MSDLEAQTVQFTRKLCLPKNLDSKLSLKLTVQFIKMTRRKFTSKFKAKVAIEVLKERDSLTVLAQKYELLPQQITN
jgi:hypothetical protein